METLEIILLSICVLLALAFILVRVVVGGKLGLLIKTLASFAFVASAIIGLGVCDAIGNTKLVMSLIALGLLLGMIGDIVLDLKVIYEGNDKYYLNSGMLAFFLGHISYISAFSIIASRSIQVWLPLLLSAGGSIVITLGIVLSSKKMGLNFGNYLVQTILYSFILSFGMIYTFVLGIMDVNMWLAFVGLVLFFLSDIVLSFQYFGGKLTNKPLIVINHALYYSAQIIILAVLFVL